MSAGDAAWVLFGVAALLVSAPVLVLFHESVMGLLVSVGFLAVGVFAGAEAPSAVLASKA